MCDQRPKKLQDEEWTEEAAVMEAGQDLWTMWSLKEWAQEAPYYKFFSVAMVPGRRSVTLADINMTDTIEMPLFKEDNKDFETSLVQKPYSTLEGLGKRKAAAILGGASMGSGPSNARPTKVSKTGSGQPSTKQAKAMVDILAAHATDKDLVDGGLEGNIAVRVQWSTRAIVKLAPHSERLEFREGEGPVSLILLLTALGAEDNEGEVLEEGILGAPGLGEGDDSASVAPEGVAGDGASESAKLVWQPTDKPATEFERVTRRVGELRELEAGMADYAAACKWESAALRFKLLRLQTTLGKTWRLQETLVEARREAEEALWDILAFE
ncbi:hypothetical protein C0991_005187 [Blastosporella zonata]|nr:hypothetical protein C0991_005187 [Blastosporella zonata]